MPSLSLVMNGGDMGARYETRVSHVQLWIKGVEAQAPCGLVADDPSWSDIELVGPPLWCLQ